MEDYFIQLIKQTNYQIFIDLLPWGCSSFNNLCIIEIIYCHRILHYALDQKSVFGVLIFLEQILYRHGFFKTSFYWSIVALQCCISTVQQNESLIHIHISPFFGFPSHLGHHITLSRGPCAIQYVLIRCLFYTQYQQCICVNPNLPMYSSLPFPLW